MNEPLKDKLCTAVDIVGMHPFSLLRNKDGKIIHTDALASAIRWLKIELWLHPKIFQGDKCKTSLGLDYVEELIDAALPDIIDIK